MGFITRKFDLSHLALKDAQLLNSIAFRREEDNKVLLFAESLHRCKKLASHTKQNRKQRTRSRLQKAFFSIGKKFIFFNLKENAIFGSVSCLCR